MGMDLVSFAVMWGLMTAAMMLASVAPFVRSYQATVLQQLQEPARISMMGAAARSCVRASRGASGFDQQLRWPPVSSSTAPVVKQACGESRYPIARATSSAVPARPSGVARRSASLASQST